jgi:cell wall-associated NlpC family hydrolase
MTDEDIARFRNAARALAGAEKTVMSEVGKGLRSAARPVVNEVRAKVRSSKGTTERGVHASEVERQLHVLSKLKGKGAGSIYDPATGLRVERRVRAVQRRLSKAASLREQIAKATGSSVSASETRVALAFKVRAGNLPPSQRKLPRRWDNPGGWKHPVFGNRKIWVRQVGNPYFRTTIAANRGQVTSSVVTAMTVAAEKITHPEEGAAS